MSLFSLIGLIVFLGGVYLVITGSIIIGIIVGLFGLILLGGGLRV